MTKDFTSPFVDLDDMSDDEFADFMSASKPQKSSALHKIFEGCAWFCLIVVFAAAIAMAIVLIVWGHI